MHSRLLLSLLLLAVARVSGAGDVAGGHKEKDIIGDFDEVRVELRAKLEAPLFCSSYSDYSKTKKSCEFSEFCGFMNENHGRATLYQSPNGGSVPNYDVFRREEVVLKACYTKALRKAHNPKDDKAVKEAYGQQTLEHRKAVLKARADYLAAVSARGESAARDKIDLAAAQTAIDDADVATKSGKTGTAAKPPRTAADFEAVLSKNEARAKVRLSPQTRAAYIAYLVLDAEPVPPFKLPVLDKWETLAKDPFVDLALLYDPAEAGSAAKVAENQKLYQAKVDRAAMIFESTKVSLLEFLERSRTSTNGEQIDNMRKRVELVKFRPQPLPVDAAICVGPNAFYSSGTHDFSICPQDLEIPEESLRRTIAHEVGHAIDPCTIASPLVSVEGVRSAVSKGETAPDATGFIRYKPTGFSDTGKTRLAVDSHDNIEQSLDEIYKTHKTETVAVGIGLPQNPFASVVGCLASPESVGARMASETQAQRSLDEEIRRLRAQGATEENSELLGQMLRTRKGLHARFVKKGACGYLSGNAEQSQMQESFADWVASKVVEDDIKKADAAKRRDLAFDSMTSRLASCNSAESLSHLDPAVDGLLKKLGCSRTAPADSTAEAHAAIDNAEKATSDAHPGDADRIDRIFMANPTIAQAMGCAPGKGVKSCE